MRCLPLARRLAILGSHVIVGNVELSMFLSLIK